MKTLAKFQLRCLLLYMCVLAILPIHTHAQKPILNRIATNLNNPRGVAVLEDGRLIVAEAGSGIPGENQGRLSIFEDLNGDGNYDDPHEITPIVEKLPSYNAYIHFNPRRDAVLQEDQLDNNFEELSIFQLTSNWRLSRKHFSGIGTMNALAYDWRCAYSSRIFRTRRVQCW